MAKKTIDRMLDKVSRLDEQGADENRIETYVRRSLLRPPSFPALLFVLSFPLFSSYLSVFFLSFFPPLSFVSLPFFLGLVFLGSFPFFMSPSFWNFCLAPRLPSPCSFLFSGQMTEAYF